MGLAKWTDKKINKMDIWDMSLVKGTAMAFGIIIGAYISDFVKQNLLIFIALVILLAIKPIYKVFKR